MKKLSALLAVCLALVVNAAEPPEYLKYFDPAKGFKPAQRNLSEIYLQAAGSLEHYGSPEPYFRHMLAEHERIAKLAGRKLGRGKGDRRPARMTKDYIEKLIANWNKLSPVLQLDELSRGIGSDVRSAIRGVWERGTPVIAILNSHQDKVIAAMASSNATTRWFDELCVIVRSELQMDAKEIDTSGLEGGKRDAIRDADVVLGRLQRLQSVLAAKLPRPQATAIADAVESVFIDLAEMAHSELEAGILEWSLE